MVPPGASDEVRGVMQSRTQSLTETLTQITIGFTVSSLLSYFLVPIIWNIEPSMANTYKTVVLFTTISLIRSYIVRRAFNRRDK